MNNKIKQQFRNFIQEQGTKLLLADEELGEKAEQLDTLINFTKIIDNYDELQPILKEYFSKKAEKEKWDRRER